MAGARDGFVACTVGIGASLGSAGRGESTESAVGMWATVRGASSGCVEGERKSITDCVSCRPLSSGGVAWKEGPGLLRCLAYHGRVDRR